MNITISNRGAYRRQPGVIAVNVGRPSRWGNPVKASETVTLTAAVDWYRSYLPHTDLVRELWQHIEVRRQAANLTPDAPVVLLCGARHRPCHAEALREGLLALGSVWRMPEKARMLPWK